MTLLLVLGATDGLLAVADGRTTRTEPDGEPYAASDRARKCAIVAGAPIVALASGRMNYSDRCVAEVFTDALTQAEARATAESRVLAVAAAADACFEGLQSEHARHPIEGRGAHCIVAGFDNTEAGPQAYEFTAPATTSGIERSFEFDRDGFVAGPVWNKTSQLARTLFGLLSEDEFFERINAEHAETASEVSFLGTYTLRSRSLDEVEVAVEETLPRFLDAGTAPLDEEGVGGHWHTYRVRRGHETTVRTYPWGPKGAHADWTAPRSYNPR